MKILFKLRTYLLLAFAWLAACGGFAESLPSPFLILPQPQSVVLIKGTGLEPSKLVQVILKGDFKRPVMGEILSQLTIGKSSGKNVIYGHALRNAQEPTWARNF